MENAGHIVKYVDVSIARGEHTVLSGINLAVDKGEMVYLTGPVGSGKTSLLKTIYGELPCSGSEARVLGLDMLHLRTRQLPALRRQMGIVFQDFQLLHDRTVYKNLKFVLKATGWKDKKEIDERIDEVLHAVGMEGVKEKMPHQLSGGEQQRIAIARSLLNRPKVIIADEPTGNLDVETASNIISLLKDISQKGTAVIMSTHNISLIDKYPGIVYCCKDNTLKEMTGEDLQSAFHTDSADEAEAGEME